MIVVFLGPPGSGKGTQASLLEKKAGFTRISTGELLREEIKTGTPLGLEVKAIVEKGGFPSDKILYLLLDKAMTGPRTSFLLDGFPRTIDQAIYFEDYLTKKSLNIAHVIFFDIDDEYIIKRLSGREICPVCEVTYNIFFQPPVLKDVCDSCNHRGLIKREDDNPQTVRQRLEVYHQKTEPLKDFYSKRGLMTRIDATQNSEAVYQHVTSILLPPEEIKTTH